MNFRFFDLGLVNFKKAWDFQKEIFLKVKDNEFDAGLILGQHYPVITLGRSADKKHILVDQNELIARGISVYEIERGGSVTYHGLGQLVIYPIFNLNYFKKDINLFLRNLEGVIIAMLAKFGIKGERYNDLTGVWVGSEKIASIGIAIKSWITYHGLAINIKNNDLENFSLIRPCGMDIMMTSMETILNKEISFDEVKETVLEAFKSSFWGHLSDWQQKRSSIGSKDVPILKGEMIL